MLDGCEIITCDQGTPEWFAARCGVITASNFSDVLAKGKGITRTKLLYSTAAEILAGEPCESFAGNRHTERGKEWEDEVRSLYMATADEPVTQVGFIKRGRIGCSPDACVGDNGGLEIKTRLPHLQIEVLENGVLPPENVAQVQGQMLVTGWRFIDYISYSRGLPLFQIRVHRDLPYLSTLKTELDRFVRDVDAIVEKYKV
jgi:hypothetical protein